MNFSLAGMEFLMDMPCLEVLDVSGCPRIDDEAVACIAKIPTLTKLGLAECTMVTDASMGHIMTLRSAGGQVVH